MNWHRTWTVARTDLKQLIEAKDFWIPMSILGGLFFLIIPTILLLTITAIGDVEAVQNVSDALEVLPETAQERIQGDTPSGPFGVRPGGVPVRPDRRGRAAHHLDRGRRRHHRRRARAGHRRVPRPLPRLHP